MKLLIISLLLGLVRSLTVEVAPKEEACYVEYIRTKRTASLRVAVIEGGENYDIHIKAYGPFAQAPKHDDRRQEFFNQLLRTQRPEGSYEVLYDGFNFDTEHRGGYYKYCFDNTASSWIKRVIDFKTKYSLTNEDDLGTEDLDDYHTRKGHVDQMHRSLANLRNTLELITAEQSYVILRVRRHLKTLESNRDRVIWYSFIEFAALASLSYVQVYMLNHWFRESGFAGRTWA